MKSNTRVMSLCHLLLVATMALVLALAPMVARADVIDPETGEYGGGHVVDNLGPEFDPDQVIEPEPEPEPADTDGLPFLPLACGAIVLAAGAATVIVCLNRRPAA